MNSRSKELLTRASLVSLFVQSTSLAGRPSQTPSLQQELEFENLQAISPQNCSRVQTQENVTETETEKCISPDLTRVVTAVDSFMEAMKKLAELEGLQKEQKREESLRKLLKTLLSETSPEIRQCQLTVRVAILVCERILRGKSQRFGFDDLEVCLIDLRKKINSLLGLQDKECKTPSVGIFAATLKESGSESAVSARHQERGERNAGEKWSAASATLNRPAEAPWVATITSSNQGLSPAQHRGAIEALQSERVAKSSTSSTAPRLSQRSDTPPAKPSISSDEPYFSGKQTSSRTTDTPGARTAIDRHSAFYLSDSISITAPSRTEKPVFTGGYANSRLTGEADLWGESGEPGRREKMALFRILRKYSNFLVRKARKARKSLAPFLKCCF